MEDKLTFLLRNKHGWTEERAKRFVANLDASLLVVIHPMLTHYLESAPVGRAAQLLAKIDNQLGMESRWKVN